MQSAMLTTIAGYEFRVAVRNRAVVLFAIVFAALTLVIAYFGMSTSAEVGFQSFTRTSASLVNLVLYLVPLVALTLSILSFTGDRGARELLFAQPLTRTEILLGKMVGLFASIVTALLLGFGGSGFVIAAQAGMDGMARFLGLVGFTLLLALAFIALGALVATASRSRTGSLAFGLCVWFFFVVFYDLIVIGSVLLLKQHTANLFIFGSLFGNPVDLARVSSLLVMGSPTIFGAAGSALVKAFGGSTAAVVVLAATLVLWTVGPTAVCRSLLHRQDI